MPKENRVEETIKSLVPPLIEPSGFELLEVEYQKEGNNWILRLFIDHEKGIDLDDCQMVSNLVSDELDKLDPIPHAYLLEVSSPGIDRPLKNARDFQRFQGHQVRIKLFVPKSGKKDYQGELMGIEDGLVVIRSANEKLFFRLEEIAKANIMAEF